MENGIEILMSSNVTPRLEDHKEKPGAMLTDFRTSLSPRDEQHQKKGSPLSDETLVYQVEEDPKAVTAAAVPFQQARPS